MSQRKRALIALTVVGVSFVPAANALAGFVLSNHSELLLADD